MKRTFNVLFLTRKTRLLKSGEVPVQMRITIGGRFVELNTQRRIDPKLWNQPKERAIGKHPSCIEINRYLDLLKSKAYEIHRELTDEGITVTPIMIKERLFEKPQNCKMFFQVFEEHNARCQQLKDIDFGKTSICRYRLCLTYFKEMYKSYYSKTEDFPIKDLNAEMIYNFELFLKTDKKVSQNTMFRYMKCVKKITNMALANDWIRINPFQNIHFKEVEVIKEFLTVDELKRLIQKEFSMKRLELVRDVFLFCSFTGLAFIDVSRLTEEHIVKDAGGNLWIRIARQKTNVMCNIPLLDVPIALMEKYREHECRLQEHKILPIISNQKMNAYLKEIAVLCEINKNLTTHTARHTFATVTLASHVSIENVSKMLGHTNLKITQHYAKILDNTIMRDMENVRETFRPEI